MGDIQTIVKLLAQTFLKACAGVNMSSTKYTKNRVEIEIISLRSLLSKLKFWQGRFLGKTRQQRHDCSPKNDSAATDKSIKKNVEKAAKFERAYNKNRASVYF